MTKWEYLLDGTEYDTPELARERVREDMDIFDLENALHINVSPLDMIRELQRLDSPLFYRLLEDAEEICFEERVSEIEAEDEEDPFHENDPYVITNPMAFY